MFIFNIFTDHKMYECIYCRGEVFIEFIGMAAASMTFDNHSTEDAASFNPTGVLSRLSDNILSNIRTPPQPPSDGPQLEYLFEEDYKHGGPSWGARICYGAGSTYLVGLGLGGSWGLLDGLKNPLGRGSRRLRVNCILNACTARGPFVANNLGMLALLYNLVHGGVIHVREGKADMMSAVGSAGLAGAVFKSTAGVRPAALAAGLFAGGMGLYQLACEQRIL
jgi:import inner membrane translocase subunit TIM23